MERFWYALTVMVIVTIADLLSYYLMRKDDKIVTKAICIGFWVGSLITAISLVLLLP